MSVLMVKIGRVRVRVHQRLVPVPMAVRLARRRVRAVLVLMVLVVGVRVFVVGGFVRVLVLVVFREMQPDTERHQTRGWPEKRGGLFA